MRHTILPATRTNAARRLLALAGAVMAATATVGCSSSGTTPGSADATATRPAIAVTDGAPMFSPPPKANVAADGMVRGSLAYPTGDPRTSAIVLEKAVPAEVLTNKPYTYELTVHNISKTPLENVEVTESLPPGLRLADKVEGAMAFNVTEAVARLTVGTLQPGERKTYRVSATATAQGAVTNSASVTYDSNLTLATAVVQPKLTMTAELPNDVLISQSVPFKITLTNSGTGTARNVKLVDSLPDHVTTEDGQDSFDVAVGDIAAGETKLVELRLKLQKVGAYRSTAIATADDGLRAEASAVVAGHQPVLELTKSGPKQQYVGVPFVYDITVTNTGDADATNVQLTDLLPGALIAQGATEGGVILDTSRVQWTIRKLSQGETRTMQLTVKANDPGTASNSVTATADGVTPVTVSAQTNLQGVPAIAMEVVDEIDPVIVGNTASYTISITNQGSAPATNVKIASLLESPMELVSAKGATNSHLDGGTLTFDPLASLAPKAKALYTVVVKAKEAGDVRFKTTLTSDQLKRPVEELEATTFYK